MTVRRPGSHDRHPFLRNPSSFRQALTDKLRSLATTSRWTLQQLQRQMAYDRFLERLYLVDGNWVVKGATALLAHYIGVRATIDIDVYLPAARVVAEAELRQAADMDIGDWFRFEIGSPRPIADTGGVRLPVTAFVGSTRWAAFHVDLVGSNLRMTGEPEDVPPLAAVSMPDLSPTGRAGSRATRPRRDAPSCGVHRHWMRPLRRPAVSLIRC
jgi:hypothetical protein